MRSVDSRLYKVLMVGPSLDSQGGMASFGQVASGLFDADDGVSIDYFPSVTRGSKFKKLVFGVRSFLRFGKLVEDYDLVHINYASGVSTLRKRVYAGMAKRSGVKVVLHSHGSALEGDLLRGDSRAIRQVNSICNHADAIILLSEEWREIYRSVVCIDCRLFVLENAVNILAYSAGCRHISIDHDPLRLLYLGRLDPEKGVEDLLFAIASLRETYLAKRIDLTIAGSGASEYVEKCMELSRRLSVDAHFVGWVSGREKDALLLGSDAFVLPSHREALPISLLEAMGAGLACVATDVGSVATVVEDGENGLLVTAGNVNCLSSAIARLASDDDLRNRVSCNAVATIEARYSIPILKTNLKTIYQEVIEHG